MTAFSQSKDLYKVFFNTKHQYLDVWEELLIEDAISVSFYEIESQTIESQAIESHKLILAGSNQIIEICQSNGKKIAEITIKVCG